MLRDQTESPEYESVRGLRFGRDSRRLAYIVKQKAGPRLVVDGQEVATVDGVYPRVGFTRKGERWFALTAEGFVVEGVQEPLVRGRRGYDPWEWGPACISQDGTRFGFVHWPMQESRELVVHGPLGEELHRDVGPRRDAKHGKDGPAYDEVASLAFSPDSRHFAYAARRKDKWMLVVDGVEGGAYDSLTGRTIAFDGPRHLHTMIERGGEYLLLEVEIPSK